MGKIAYVRLVFSNGEMWEYLADSLARGRRDIEYLWSRHNIARYRVVTATPIQLKELIEYHSLKPKISNRVIYGICHHCGKEVTQKVPYGEKIFCSRNCLIRHFKGV